MGHEDFWFLARLRRGGRFENPVTELKRSQKPKRPPFVRASALRHRFDGNALSVTAASGDEAFKTWKEQVLKGQLVLTTSANAAVAKKGSVACDVSKAAGNHLVRELAIELAPLARVNGVAPATVMQGSAMFPRDRVVGSLANYNIAYKEGEATESRVIKLAQFYADRTLIKAPSHRQIRRKRISFWSRSVCPRRPARSSPWTAACTKRFCADAVQSLGMMLAANR